MPYKLKRPDQYLTDPTRLKGQPKAAIADYVERNGILVPRRFATFDEARKSGVTLIARSEHTQEYDGVSGLCYSAKFGGKELNDRDLRTWNAGYFVAGVAVDRLTDEDDLKRRAFLRRQDSCQEYCRCQGLDVDTFCSELSWSYWELLEGANRTVVADSAIPERYHIMTASSGGPNYVIAQDGHILCEFTLPPLTPLTDELRAGLMKLIETYESIRNLEHFDPTHCPIMEFQTVDGKDYFLQYHRTRDFKPALFVLDRGSVNDEIELQFVRGATETPQGTSYRVNVCTGKHPQKIGADEGYLESGIDFIWDELSIRKLKFELINYPWGLEKFFGKMVIGHSSKSKLFKPGISTLFVGQLFTSEERAALFKRARSEHEDQYVNMHIVSDGNRAFLRVDR